jgi:hypothetical protein
MSRESLSATQIGVMAGDDWQITCHTYKWTTPILSVRTGSETVTFSVRSREDMPSSGVAFARELAQVAGQFAAECERLHELHKASGQPCAQEQARAAASQ